MLHFAPVREDRPPQPAVHPAVRQTEGPFQQGMPGGPGLASGPWTAG